MTKVMRVTMSRSMAHVAARHSVDYVIGAGQQYSIRDFVDCAAKELDLQLTER